MALPDDEPYEYDWDYEANLGKQAYKVGKEDETLRLLEQEQVITCERTPHPESQNREIKLIKDPTLVNYREGSEDKTEVAWTLRIIKIDPEKLHQFLEQQGFELAGDSVIEKPRTSPSLPPVRKRISPDFTVHTNNSISYRGRIIELEGQQAVVAAKIMLATLQGQPLDTNAIAVIAGTGRATKIISELRTAFRNATGKKDHNFFPNLKTIGYKFSP